MVILVLLCLINVVVCERCPVAKYGNNCEYTCRNPHCFCNSFWHCGSCEVGYWNISYNCSLTCMSATCRCTDYTNCLSCKEGYYGLESKCDKKCYSGCNVNKCYDNGTCECKANFTGSKCDLCVDGRYGANCSMQCSRGCEGNICNFRDGTCNCIRNYSGVKCEYCIEGHYGKDCLNTCSIGCFENTCSSSDGTCDCKEYYKGDKCDTCVDGKYGANCLLQCSQGCERSTCSSTEGSCNCHIHYSGGKCENCMTGWYGDNCSKQCSQGCLENTCSHTDGKCDCKDFYRGDKCDMCVDGMYGGHCLNKLEQNPANKTDSVPAGVLTGGVISAVVVIVAAAALSILVKRRLSQKVAKSHRTERSTTHQGGESAQTEPYEALNSSRMEESDSRDIYTRLFMTGQAAMTERVNPDCSATNMLNDVGGKAAQSKEYETLNATRLKEGDRSDNYRTLLTTGQTGYTDDGNSENISMYNPTICSDPHSYANMKLKK